MCEISLFPNRRYYLLKKSPRCLAFLPQPLPLNLHDPTSLGPKAASLATGPAHPSEPAGSAKLLPNKQRLLLQPLHRRHYQLIRVPLWTRRDLRARTVLNTAMVKAVWGLI